MMGIGRHAFHAEQQDVLQGENIAVDIRVGLQADLFSLGDQAVEGCRRLESGRRLGKINFTARRAHFFLQAFPQGHALPDQTVEALGIEIHIGDYGKKRRHR